MGHSVCGLSSSIRAGTLWLGFNLCCVDPLATVVMETFDCFDLHDLMLNNDDDIQNVYCKLYNFCMKSLEYSAKLKAKFKKVKLEKDDLIAKLDEAKNLNENFKNQISSQVGKIKSLEEQLVESKTEVEKLTSAKHLVEPNSKEKDF